MPISRMSAEPAETAGSGDNPVYTYRPSLLGTPWAFRLTDNGLEWSAGSKSGRVAWRDVRRVRMSYRPASMQSHRFITELWADGAPKLQIVSSSWKSLVEQERLDKPYSAFVAELHRRIARAGATPRFERGNNPLIYWPGLIVFTGMGLALVLLMFRVLADGALGGAAVVAAFFVLFLWQCGNIFRRNWPGVYRPDALPEVLLPKG